jgi:hypothetical protein
MMADLASRGRRRKQLRRASLSRALSWKVYGLTVNRQTGKGQATDVRQSTLGFDVNLARARRQRPP